MESLVADRAAKLPSEVVHEVLWKFGDLPLGWQPGSFADALIRALSAADRENFARLALGFPEYAEAVYLVKYVDGGMGLLRDRVKAELS